MYHIINISLYHSFYIFITILYHFLKNFNNKTGSCNYLFFVKHKHFLVLEITLNLLTILLLYSFSSYLPTPFSNFTNLSQPLSNCSYNFVISFFLPRFSCLALLTQILHWITSFHHATLRLLISFSPLSIAQSLPPD